MAGIDTTSLSRAREWTAGADAVLITAGAGMGVDSGLPDFRGNDGFWNAYPPIRDRGISFYEMANPGWFFRDSRLAWGFYGHRLNLYRRTVPHRGFSLLLDYAKSRKNGYFVYTSNVDGHFQKAGFSPDRIEECHGSINWLQCSNRCGEVIWSADDAEPVVDETTFLAEEPLPTCPNCGEVARPNILMFGDPVWIEHRSSEQTGRFLKWLGECRERQAQVLVVEIGAGTAIPSVRYRSENMCLQEGARLIRINPREAEVPEGQIGLEMGGLAGLQAIFQQMR
jgi:NAD-dependent SIR2 family protein deacetylase